MANYNVLKTAIQNAIKANGNNAITGPVLQSELISMVNVLGAGYQYFGVAQPSTNPGNPDSKCFFVAYTPGTYVNFDGIVVTGLCILKYDTVWRKENINISGGSGSVVTFNSLSNGTTQILVDGVPRAVIPSEYTLLKLSAFTTTPSGLANGAFYYNISDKKIYQKQDPSVAVIPYYDGAIYTYNNELYVWNGTDLVNVSGGGADFLTEPDDLTLQTVGETSLLKFADRQYYVGTPNGLGYKILRKDSTFAMQIVETNTIFEIRYDFNLGGASVQIPANSVLKFNGGKIVNGTIVGNNTGIIWGQSCIFGTDITLSGTFKNDLNPIMFGVLLPNANVFECLYATHTNALAIGCPVSYKGIKSLSLVVSNDFVSIPISDNTDFCGCEITISNSVKDFYLFSKINPNSQESITIAKAVIDSGDFSAVSGFPENPALLVIKDTTAWVPYRYDQGADGDPVYRYDLLVCLNKKAVNTTIFPYNTGDSMPECYYQLVSPKLKEFKNVSFIRSGSKKSQLVTVNGEYNLTFSGIFIKTDNSSNLTSDQCIRVQHCANITFKDITIQNTHSTSVDSGYAIYINNIVRIICENIDAIAEWGIFDGNNLNQATVRNCKLNRFDCHCYGRDFLIEGCVGTRVQAESMFGTLEFHNCRYPAIASSLVIGTGGYISTEYDVIVRDCSFEKNDPEFVNIKYLSHQVRTDVRGNCLPNMYFENIIHKGQLFYIMSELSGWSARNFVNRPNVVVKGLWRENGSYINLMFSRYGKTVPGKPINLVLRECKNVIFFVTNTALPTLSTVVASVIYEDSYFNAGRNTNLDALESYGIPIYFNNCLVDRIRYGGTGKGTIKFFNCYLPLSADDGTYSYLFKAIYEKCTIKAPAGKLIRNPYAAEAGVILKDCMNADGNTAIFQGLPASQIIDFEMVGDGNVFLNKLQIFASASDVVGLDSKQRAFGFLITEGKQILWNGTAWVNVDGTALT